MPFYFGVEILQMRRRYFVVFILIYNFELRLVDFIPK